MWIWIAIGVGGFLAWLMGGGESAGCTDCGGDGQSGLGEDFPDWMD